MTNIEMKIGAKYWTVENDTDGDIGDNYKTKAAAVAMAKKMRADDKENGMTYIGNYSVLENIVVDRKGIAWVIENRTVYRTR